MTFAHFPDSDYHKIDQWPEEYIQSTDPSISVLQKMYYMNTSIHILHTVNMVRLSKLKHDAMNIQIPLNPEPRTCKCRQSE